MPEGPPLNFRWRRAMHRVARAEGPERIGAEWWLNRIPEVEAEDKEGQGKKAKGRSRKAGRGSRDGAADRDYFRVEDTDGHRFWLYREGLYEPKATPRWYLHGVSA